MKTWLTALASIGPAIAKALGAPAPLVQLIVDAIGAVETASARRRGLGAGPAKKADAMERIRETAEAVNREAMAVGKPAVITMRRIEDIAPTAIDAIVGSVNGVVAGEQVKPSMGESESPEPPPAESLAPPAGSTSTVAEPPSAPPPAPTAPAPAPAKPHKARPGKKR